MSILITDLLRQAQNGKVAESSTEALREVSAAAIAARKPGELTLKIKVVPETQGRQTTLEFDVSTKSPRPKLPKGIFWMSDNYDLLRADPDQREMFAGVTDGGRPYTPPRAVGDE